MIHLLKGHVGRDFRAHIKGVPVKGKVQLLMGVFYLCQNSIMGSDCTDKLGFTKSWSVGRGTQWDLDHNSVDNFEIISANLKNEDKTIEENAFLWLSNLPTYETLSEDGANYLLNGFIAGANWYKND